MNQDTGSTKKAAASTPASTTPPKNPTQPPQVPKVPPLFRPIDWIALGVTTLLVFLGYLWTISPDVTLEDSGELAVGSMYAGVPHPPGYPFWTVYTWFFTKILPFSNIAWRVAVASAFAGALGCGLIAFVTSRGSSMMIESVEFLKNIERRHENLICIVSGLVAGMLMGFNGYMWSQSVIVEVYSLSVLSLMLVITFLLRWTYQPEKKRYLYWAFLFFGICLTNHMSLLVAAMGIEILIAAVQPKLGRDLFLGNALVFVIVLFMKMKGDVSAFDNNAPLFAIFVLIGVGSMLACGWYILQTQKLLTEWKAMLLCGLAFGVGAAFYLYMPVASMSNPPMNWGYPRTAEGFLHALKRGQYESVHPATDVGRFVGQLWMYVQGAIEEFNWVYLLIALVPFAFYRFMQRRERSWIIGLSGIFFFLSVLLLILLNPGLDRQSVELNRVFFTASHVVIAIGVGYGLTLIAASLVTNYERLRRFVLIGAAVAVAFGLYSLATVIEVKFGGEGFFYGLGETFKEGDITLKVYGGLLLLFLTICFLGLVIVFRKRIIFPAVLAIFALMPVHSILSHWFENEQRGHMFGYWFGHDMFSLDAKDILGSDGKPIYPNIEKDSVVFGGTDPGRFNPTYMIFCESFTPAKDKPRDPEFDRRDCYLITQNALADGTYLNYIRAHYNRSTQIDPPFFQNFSYFRVIPRFILRGLDNVFMGLGEKIEKKRRAGTSYFDEADFKDVGALAAKIKDKKDPVSQFIFEHLKLETQQALGGGNDKDIARLLARDLNQIIEREYNAQLEIKEKTAEKDELQRKWSRNSGKIEQLEKEIAELAKLERLYSADRFKDVKLSDHSRRYIKEDPKSHTSIRWNRLLLEDAYPTEIAKSIAGVYPDLEIYTPTPEDSQRCFNEYLVDAQKRYERNQLKPGEDFKVIDNRVQVSGQVAVMAINGLLTKVIFDNNPGHEFYVEESFPLEWMFPHLTPSGVIMKINRQPLAEITEDIVKKDHEFWSKYSDRLIGNWITYDTPVTNICEWAEQVYMRHDLRGFKGDPKFVRDDNAQKAFSKLRSSIAGIYSWRLGLMGFECAPQYRAAKNPAELQRVTREAEFAFKQAFAYCPFSPEAVYRFVQFLHSQNRTSEAIAIARTCSKLDPENDSIRGLISQLEGARTQMQSMPKGMDGQAIYNEVNRLIAAGQTNQALTLLDQLATHPGITSEGMLFVVRAYYTLGDSGRLEKALERYTTLAPEDVNGWYDLALLQGLLQRPTALETLKRAIALSDIKRLKDPKERNIREEAAKDQRFGALRENPQFKKLVEQK